MWVMLAPSLRRHKCIRGLCFRHTKSPCSHHEPPHPISLAALSLCTGLCSLCHPTTPPVPSPAPPCSLDTPLTATSTDPFAGATPQCTPLPPLGHPHPFFSFQKVSSPPSSGKKSPFAREAPCYASRLPAHWQFQNPPPPLSSFAMGGLGGAQSPCCARAVALRGRGSRRETLDGHGCRCHAGSWRTSGQKCLSLQQDLLGLTK